MAILFFIGGAVLALTLVGGVGAAITAKAIMCFTNTF